MKIDFNNVRLQAIGAYNGLVRTLNANTNDRGVVTIEAYEIERELEYLRQTIGSIACTYEDGNEDFQCVLTDDVTLDVFGAAASIDG